MADTLIKIASWLYGLPHRKEFAHSRAFEGNAAHMSREEGYWWCYKYYVRPVEEEESGSGLEAYFRGQNLDFTPRDGFRETAGMTLCAGGDLMPHSGLQPHTTGALWDDVRKFYCTGDIVCANLESPVQSSKPPRYIPKSVLEHGILNNTPEMFDRMTEGGRGVNFFSTANNHCMDMGESGIRETLDFLDARGYPHVGTARSPEERDRTLIQERNGIKVAFLSFTYALNWSGHPEGKDFLANYVRLNKPETDLSPVARQVRAARAAGADAVVALIHWGLEFESFPIRSQVETGHRLIELGLDVIIGNHPHNVQPAERYAYTDSAGKRREGLILYALGDLLSIHRTLPNSRLACLSRIRISKGTVAGRTETRVTSLEVLPVYLHVGRNGRRVVDYRVLDFRNLADELRAGKDRYGLGKRKAREVFRLEALMRRILGPALRTAGRAP